MQGERQQRAERGVAGRRHRQRSCDHTTSLTVYYAAAEAVLLLHRQPPAVKDVDGEIAERAAVDKRHLAVGDTIHHDRLQAHRQTHRRSHLRTD